MRKGRYSFVELLLHVDADKGVKFTTNSLGFELGLEFMNLLFDLFEETMFLNSSELFILMQNNEIFKYELTKIDNKSIRCKFFKKDLQSSPKELSNRIVTLGQFVNDGLKNVIDTVIGLRDLSNEMNRLLNEYVDQNNIKSLGYYPSY